MLTLPSDRKLNVFAPVCGTEEDGRRLELERKRSWLRKLREQPEWTTKNEALEMPPVVLQPMPCPDAEACR